MKKIIVSVIIGILIGTLGVLAYLHFYGQDNQELPADICENKTIYVNATEEENTNDTLQINQELEEMKKQIADLNSSLLNYTKENETDDDEVEEENETDELSLIVKR